LPIKEMVMIDVFVVTLATLAVGIPAIMTAATLGSKLRLYW
jgi:hypothetical protein